MCNIEHPAWIANRNSPINRSTSGVLIIDPSSGNLVVKYKGDVLLVLYSDGSGSGFNRTATLLDYGNFVLKEGNVTLWQSFDYPTDTLLPGMKLGINHKTNKTWSLTSWAGIYRPRRGAFALEWDPSKKALVVKYRGKVHWTTGRLMNNSHFENINPPGHYNLSYEFKNVTSEDDEEYFTFKLVADPGYIPKNVKMLSDGWLLGYRGNVYEVDNMLIGLVDDCYGYTPISDIPYPGCELWEQPKCRNNHQRFETQTGYFQFNVKAKELADVVEDKNASHTFSDCKAKCWEDCDCYAFINNGDTCIFYRRGILMFHNSGGSDKIHTLLSLSESGSSNSPKKRKEGIKIVIVPVVIAVASFLLMFLYGVLLYRRKKIKQAKENKIQELMTMNGYTDTISELGNDGRNDLKFFSFTSVAAATRNFSSDNKLGEGGFGPVYKGEFPKGQEIAVKRLSRKSTQGMTELKNELILIAKLQHTNLVRLLGCCIHKDDKMLIYEYMPNKSLDYFLFDENKRDQLTWERRFSIIEGIAQGLLYLHKYSRLKIIHRDLKAANILLDQNMNPKISDFGLARILKQNLSETNTSRVVGTYGYMAPEYVKEGKFSVKSDVYSFGVLILEILSGRKTNSFNHVDESPSNLVAFAWELWNRNAAFELMDSSIRDSCQQNQFLRCINLSLLCVEDLAADRPTMVNVISMLANGSAVLPLPKRPAFYAGKSFDESQDRKSDKISVNGVTISAVEAR